MRFYDIVAASAKPEYPKGKEKVNIYQKNLSLLQKHYPEIASVIDTPAPFDAEVLFNEKKLPNIKISGESGTSFLYDEKDPYGDIGGLMNEVRDLRASIVCFMGIGIGIHGVEVVRNIGATNIVVLFEAIPLLFKCAMSCLDLEEIICHPNVILVVGENSDPERIIEKEYGNIYACNKNKFLMHRTTVSLAQEWYDTEKNRYDQFLNRHIVEKRTVSRVGTRFFRNRFRNILAMNDSSPLNTLKGIFKDQPAIVVASGPSLSQNIQEINKAEKNAVIIAVDSAVGPLLKNGITPHYVAALDFSPVTYEKLQPFSEKLSETKLLFMAEVTPEVPNYLDFKERYYSSQPSKSYLLINDVLGVENKPLSDAQSVAHLALATAQIMDCDPIIFTGLDLAFTKKQDHAEGTVVHWKQAMPNMISDVFVEDIHGEMVPTHYGFLSIKEVCEKLIKQVPERNYIDASEGGAKVFGTQIRTLSETISEYCKDEIGFEDEHSGSDTQDTETILKRLKDHKSAILKIQNKLGSYFKDLSVVDEYFEKHGGNIKKIADFPSNIMASIKKMNNVTKLCNDDVTISYIGELLYNKQEEFLKIETERMVKEVGDSEFDRYHKEHRQQVFVQKIRQETLEILRGEVQNQIDFFSQELKSKRAIDNQPDNDLHKIALIEHYLENNYISKAKSTALEIDKKKDPKAIFLEGKIRVLNGDVEEGKKRIDLAVSKDDSLEAERMKLLEYLTENWLKKEGPPSAQRILAKRLDSFDPGNEHAAKQIKRIDGLQSRNQTYRTVEDAKKIIETGDAEDAVKLLNSLEEIHEDFLSDWHVTSARAYLQTGRHQEGVNNLEEAVKLNAIHATLWDELGDVLFNSKDYNNAVVAYEKCFTALPEMVDSLRKIGDCYLSMGHVPSSIAAYEAVLQRQPDNEFAAKHLEIAKKAENQ